jgi:hypothetical protein
MRTSIAAGVWLSVTLLLAACGVGTTGSSVGSPVAVNPGESEGPSPSEATVEPSTSGTPLPTVEPSGETGFACDLPVHGGGTAARANITDVRVGTHDGYDRIVFQFRGGIPEFDIKSATPPFTADPSDQPLMVNGSSFLSITLHGGTKQTESGASSYNGPRNFTLDFPTLVHLVEGGDFEAVSTWYAGLTHAACARVSTLTGPDRLVIDVQH